MRANIRSPKLRTFELFVRTTSPLEGGLDDWPANVQDKIFEALEKKAKEVMLPLAIVYSGADTDFDGNPCAHVIASEVVAGKEDLQGPVTVM